MSHGNGWTTNEVTKYIAKRLNRIIAAGPPFSISSKMGFREGSSLMRAIRSSNWLLWTGLTKFSSMLDIDGS